MKKVSMARWWNDTDGKIEDNGDNLSWCHFDHHKSPHGLA
jgi:hypothetical protein